MRYYFLFINVQYFTNISGINKKDLNTNLDIKLDKVKLLLIII